MLRTRLNILHVVLAVTGILLSAAAAPAEPPSDETVQTISEDMIRWLTEHRGEENYESGAEEYGQSLIADLDFSGLTLDQVNMLQPVVAFVPEAREAAEQRLDVLAEQKDAEGVKAATMLFALQFDSMDAQEKTKRLKAILHHPALQEAFESGDMDMIFSYISFAGDQVTGKLSEELVELERLFDENTPPAQLTAAQEYIKTLQRQSEKIAAEAREKIRTKLVRLHEKALEGLEEGNDRLAMALEQGLDFLNSPMGRGEFLGHPAPEISFIWSSTDQPLSSLEDLKGQVVVLDFWATWCGPCIRSFPDVRKLAARYEGYPVAIVGVTSLQGRHYPPDGDPIDTDGDAEKEFSLMPEFMEQMDMTWTVAFSEQEVFNADYGVRGIPHVAIIDAEGKVRYNGLHPSSEVTPFVEKTSKIDKLLKEAGLDHPEPYKPGKDKEKDEEG